MSTPLTAQEKDIRNGAYFDALEFIEPVILDKSVEQPRVFVNMIPRSEYALGSGLVQKQELFYGDRGVQGGMTGWQPIQTSRPAGTNGADDPGYDACKQYDAEMVEHGFEERTFTGFFRNRRTYDICINDMKWKLQFAEQIDLVFGNLAQITVGEWDNIGREAYVSRAKKYVMAGGAPESVSFNYDPLTSSSITLAAGTDVSALQWDFLEYFHQWLTLQARPSATGNYSGQPIWSLVIDPKDFNDMIHRDPSLMNTLNFARPQVLLDNYGSVEYFKGYALNYDMQTPRYDVSSNDGTTITLKRLDYRIYSSTTHGLKHSVNPAYMNAEFAMGIIFMKDVYELQVPPAGPASPGGGTRFGIQPNLMGTFSWMNIVQQPNNPFGEIGHYFARMQAFIRPLRWDGEAIVFLYRRIVKNPVISVNPGLTDPVLNVITGINPGVTPTVGTGDILTTSVATKIVGDGETASSYKEVTVTLASILPCSAPDMVNVKYGGAFGTTAVATIVTDNAAPTYTLVFETAADWVTLMGAAGAAKVGCQ